jgi:hypothetical protein
MVAASFFLAITVPVIVPVAPEKLLASPGLQAGGRGGAPLISAVPYRKPPS